ncbi:MAG: phosphatase PAP2 family protein [Alphaproteobacteria bacterium]|nr:phosphatase PAP2 family protein [Alphaproteobacteria bacterium]
MFIRSDNSLKTKWIWFALLLTIVLVICGVFLFDQPLYLMLRNTNCSQWSFTGGAFCVISNLLAKLFNAKTWLCVFGFLSVMLCVKDYINSKNIKQVLINLKTTKTFYVFCSVFCASVVVCVLKYIIGRSRPILFEALDKVLFVPGTYNSVFNSMPSGHTTATFAGFVMLGMLFPKIKPITWGMCIIVGLSRIYIGAHWPSDVILGAFIGMVTADIIKHVLSNNSVK